MKMLELHGSLKDDQGHPLSHLYYINPNQIVSITRGFKTNYPSIEDQEEAYTERYTKYYIIKMTDGSIIEGVSHFVGRELDELERELDESHII